jgi:phosphate-selective porin OprO/OprP
MKSLKFTLIFLIFNLYAITLNSQENQKNVFTPTLKMEGRIMFDFNFLNAGDYQLSGNEFRRVRLAAKGKVTKEISYKAEFDFAGGAVNFRDVYLKYTLPKNNGKILIGSFTEPTSLDNMTSSKYITFFERSMLANTQPFKYSTGIMYDNQHLFKNKVGLQLAYTFNGDKNEAFKDNSLGQGANLIARVTTSVLNDKEKNRVVHFGLNYEHRNNDKEDYSYSFRVENHMGDKIKVQAPGVFENTNDIGFEFATTLGSFSFQTEYELASIKTNLDTFNVNSYYAFVSYFITGEHRPYKNSTFGRVKPIKDFLKDGGYGAFELVGRYSTIDLTDFQGTDTGDKINNLTLGFNWYLNKQTRIMYNYTNADFNDYTDDNVVAYNDNNLVGHLIRFQIDF